MPSTQVRKLLKLLREDGMMTAIETIVDHGRHTAAALADGTPGHYRLRQLLLERQYDSAAITPIWVSPDDITALTGEYERREDGHLDYVPHFKPREASWDSLPFERELPYGAVVEGNWDQSRVPFSELLMYRGIRQRYVDDHPWSETVYYAELVDRFREQGLKQHIAETLALERCENIEAVYQAIDTDGYRSQRELHGHPLHEITVTIARDGTLLYNCEGRHRLSIAKILDIEAVPVLVLARHAAYDPQTTDQANRQPQQ